MVEYDFDSLDDENEVYVAEFVRPSKASQLVKLYKIN
jgi:hypothetical protein